MVRDFLVLIAIFSAIICVLILVCSFYAFGVDELKVSNLLYEIKVELCYSGIFFLVTIMLWRYLYKDRPGEIGIFNLSSENIHPNISLNCFTYCKYNMQCLSLYRTSATYFAGDMAFYRNICSGIIKPYLVSETYCPGCKKLSLTLPVRGCVAFVL